MVIPLPAIVKKKGSLLKSSFDAMTQDPRSFQKKYLLKILNKNKLTEYGQRYNFAQIYDEKDFQKYVPINRYQDLVSFIEL